VIGLLAVGAIIVGGVVLGAVGGYIASKMGEDVSYTVDNVSEASDSPISFRKESKVSKELIGALGLTGQITYLDSGLTTEINDTMTVDQVGADQASFSYSAPSFTTSVLPAIVKSIQIYSDTLYYRHAADDGPIIDNLKDWDSIQKNGEKKLKIGNNFIVGKTQKGLTSQLDDIGNFWWQWIRTKPHTYQVIVSGAWYELDPADVFTFAYNSSAEDIDSIIEITGIAVNDTEFPSTEITMQEIEENPKTDRTIKQRIRNKGSVNRSSRSSVNKVIAAAGYVGKADYYCSGVNDNEIFQQLLTAATPGLRITLTKGTYNLTAGLTCAVDVEISGDSQSGTILSLGDFPDEPFYTSSDGSKIIITNLTIQADSSSGDFLDNNNRKSLLRGVKIDLTSHTFSSSKSDRLIYGMTVTGCIINIDNLDFNNRNHYPFEYGEEFSGNKLTINNCTNSKSPKIINSYLSVYACDITIDKDFSSTANGGIVIEAIDSSTVNNVSITISGTQGIGIYGNATGCYIIGGNKSYYYVSFRLSACVAKNAYCGFYADFVPGAGAGESSVCTAEDCSIGFWGGCCSACITNDCTYGFYSDTIVGNVGCTGCVANGATYGFYNWYKLSNCQSSGTAYTNCYASNSTAQAAADTANGGYNS